MQVKPPWPHVTIQNYVPCLALLKQTITLELSLTPAGSIKGTRFQAFFSVALNTNGTSLTLYASQLLTYFDILALTLAIMIINNYKCQLIKLGTST